MPRSHPVVAAHLIALVLLCSATALGAASTTDSPTATIVEVYPNTNHAGNAGEYLVVDFPDDSELAEYSLTDGKTSTPLGEDSVLGAVAFSRAPDLTREKVDRPVYGLPEHFAMAQTGEAIRLYRGDRLVDETSYESASQGERWLRSDEGWGWEKRGATDFEARDIPAERATAFALPDSPEVPLDTLRSADERLYLGGYSLESERVVEELLAAHERGVDVRVLVDGTPVGGQSETEAEALDRLAAAGVDVRVFDGPRPAIGSTIRSTPSPTTARSS